MADARPNPSNTLPIITLLVLTTVMPELFSGSTPPSGFFNPGLLLFLFLGYGVAVLLVRELAVRWSCGLKGLFFLGLAYSIFNEGLLAKTLIVQQNLPIRQYDHFGYYLGVSLPWAAGIGTWHACASVIFPIAFTHFFFADAAKKPWLESKTAIALATILLLLSCAVFLGTSQKGVKGTPAQLAVLLTLMLIGFVVARLFKGDPYPNSIKGSPALPILLGLSVLLPFWGLAALASVRLPPFVFLGTLIAVILLYAWILKRRQWLATPGLLFFALGWYLHNAGQALIFISLGAKLPGRALATAIADLMILILLFTLARREPALETQAPIKPFPSS